VSSAAVIATATFDITSDHCSAGDGCLDANTGASGGTITVTQNDSGTPLDTTDDTLTFDVALNPDLQFINGGQDATFGFDLVGNPQITYSSVTTGFAPATNPQSAGTLHLDGTGFFEYGVNCTGCGPGGSAPLAGPLDFTISATGGLTLASLQQNADGQIFAIDVINTAANPNVTGFVDASSGTIVVPPQEAPEPGILALLSAGLLAVGFSRIRKPRN